MTSLLINANALHIPLADKSVNCVVTSPPYYGTTAILWYNECMNNNNGRFKKGEHRSPSTEFKKGEHWRQHKPYWDKEWLESEYTEKQRSANEIANQFGITESAILFWLRKHNIQTRSMADIRAIKYWGLSGEKNGMYGKTGIKNAIEDALTARIAELEQENARLREENNKLQEWYDEMTNSEIRGEL